MAAFAEGTMTGIMYLFVPFYWLIFLSSNFGDLQRHVLRVVLGVGMLIAGGVMMAKSAASEGDDEDHPRIRSRVHAAVDDETDAPKEETATSRSGTPAPAPAQNQNTAAPPPPAEERITVAVRFMTMLSNGQVVDGTFGE